MVLKKKSNYIVTSIASIALALASNSSLWAQVHTPFLSQNHWTVLAAELNQQGIYPTARLAARLSLQDQSSYFLNNDPVLLKDRASYLGSIAGLAIKNDVAAEEAKDIIQSSTNTAYIERLSYALAQYYFIKGKWPDAIRYYEAAKIDNLSNSEIVQSKFELAYCYFNNLQFDKAEKAFTAIKEVAGKYKYAANYYYGLLAYNKGNYAEALKSFGQIEQQNEYKNVVPYYIAEILYFDGAKEQSLQKAISVIGRQEKSFYDNELHLLAAQCLFEAERFKEAIPYFEYYYNKVAKIRKQDIYKMAFSYYRNEDWTKAIEPFQQLSSVQDVLGQTSMYLLGDCYLKTGDKKGAKNAFSMCSEMSYNPALVSASLLLSGKLAFDLGYNNEGSAQLKKLIADYPKASYASEAANILSEQLLLHNNYAEAYQMLHNANNVAKNLLQKSSYGLALQKIQHQNWSAAEQLLDEALQNNIASDYEAASYFWKAEINYHNKNYAAAIYNGKAFLAKNSPAVSQLCPDATQQNAYMTLGYAALNHQDFAGARTYFAQAQNKTSNSHFSAKQAADAALREADAAFLQKDYAKAIELYDKTIASNNNDADYALFQKSSLLGLQGKSAEQADILLAIVDKKNPISPYKYEAHYALGDLHLDANKFEDAINHFQKINDQTAKHLVAKALMKIGYAYQEADNTDKAIEAYKKVVFNYPNSDQRMGALEALKNLYVSSNQPKAYVQLLKENNIASTDNASVDSLFYAAAEAQFAANKYDKAIEAMSNYLTQYPQGIFKIKAHFYSAESHYQRKEYDSALAHYNTVLQEAWTDFTEPAAIKASSIALAQNKFSNAENYYTILKNNAIGKNNIIVAYKGLMLCADRLHKNEISLQYADTLLRIPEIDQDTKDEAYLLKANNYLSGQKWADAQTLYQQIINSKNIELSAEAHYHLAELLLLDNKLTEAENATNKAIQQTIGSTYWNTKSYLLMSDVFVAEKDFFNAKATLQSVIKNATIEALKKEAQEKLERVKVAEKKKSKLSEG